MKLDDFPHLSRSNIESAKKLKALQEGLLSGVDGPHDDVCVLAVGSYGRREAQAEVSDFEWMTVYDDSRVAASEALVLQARLTAYFADVLGREKLSINKTFGEVASFSDLTTNIGGEQDTNRFLTYRMLVLSEGAPINGSKAYDQITRRLAVAYGTGHTAGHRLLSLATDIARYWRTLRIDYKYKVDERGKPWAVRALKLRSARRLSYFSSALHMVAFGPRIDYATAGLFELSAVHEFMKTMSGNPVERLIQALEKVGADETVGRALLTHYEDVHRDLGDLKIRKRLDELSGEERMKDEAFVRVRANCLAMHSLLAELARGLPKEAQQQLLEMFLL